VPGTYTAQAFITTDADDNQITAFHPGAMAHAHLNRVADAGPVTLGIVSPDGREGMLAHAQQFAEAGIPFVFDPGQGMPMFDGPELLHFARQATYLAFNDYEARLFEERTGRSLAAVAREVRAVVITRGAQGSSIYAGGRDWAIPPVLSREVVDPTGCGDAYRAGLLFGLSRGMDWDTTGRIASLMGSIKVASCGTQNHHFTWDEFEQRFRETFGYAL
ncbi:MAG TPA: carbohydrate kinase family protein, partial [Acidiferrobacteraceae bacterium]|nr:carbohydrate kinase family protein [Acidiferrobacteraceae bacterium]